MSRTVIDLKNDLVEKAKKLTGMNKKVQLVNFALEKLIEQRELEQLLTLKGRVEWSGNIREMRKDRK
ncbi:MAG: type II toxin-antitoxin system VapB family antitoxin [Candidatus Omnitrophica bacterium]|nr:type II toxin-antitoxin system VapB family antitoxin [Candidatus Omnitrophota bacterium]